MAEALARIATGRLAPSLATQRAHVKHVRERVAGKRREEPVLTPVDAPVASGCPLCGAALHRYTYKTGAKAGQSFEGCERFPACDYRIESVSSDVSGDSRHS